jgi:hypothetical protein
MRAAKGADCAPATTNSSTPLNAAERQELVELRRKLRQVQQERDILAKATAWFAGKSEQTHTPPAFCSSLNEHVRFHVCVVDGVFKVLADAAHGDAQADADDQSSACKVIFHAASAIDEAAVAQVQATLRTRILRAFVGRGLLESFEAKDMLGYRHSAFSVDASVRIEAHDRAGLERLLRYCARPPFSSAH